MTAQSPTMISDGSITFLPDMMDPMCRTSSVECRMSAMQIMMADVKLIGNNVMRCVPEMMRSMMTMEGGGIVPGTVGEMRDMCLQMGLGCVEMYMIGMTWLVFFSCLSLAVAGGLEHLLTEILRHYDANDDDAPGHGLNDNVRYVRLYDHDSIDAYER